MYRETILVVDDDPVNIMVVRQLLGQRMQFNILEAIDGQSALDLAQANPNLDLILLDVQMSDISGIEVCRILKNSPRTRNIPIILISAVHTDDTSVAEGLEAGADGYITKPIENNMLQAWLNAALRINRLKRALDQKMRPVPEDLAELLTGLSKLSHSVNNPLQAIMASGDLLTMEHEDDPGIMQAVKMIQENAELIARMVGEASQQAKAFLTAKESD